MARDIRKLEVFQCADRLLLDVMAISSAIAGQDRFAICNQVRRAALSVPVNLVEGGQRTTTREFARYVEIAAGSAAETRYLLCVAARLAPEETKLTALEADYERLVRQLETLRRRLSDSRTP